jgi:hypothetical protein
VRAWILGDGPERTSLIELARRLEVNDAVVSSEPSIMRVSRVPSARL